MSRLRNWPLLLLSIPSVLAWFGNSGHGFVYQSGTAGCGILLLWAFCRHGFLPKRDVVWIMAAFAFSIMGDWFLSHRDGITSRFLMGIVFFFFAHVGYLGFSLMNGRFHIPVTAVLLGGFTVFYLTCLNASISAMPLKFAVYLYVVISCLSLGAAAGVKWGIVPKTAYVTAIALILFSDWIIAMNEFTSHKILSAWILPTYYLAHLCVTFGLLWRELNGRIRTSA